MNNKTSGWSVPERRVNMHVPRYRTPIASSTMWWAAAFLVIWAALAAVAHWALK